MNALCSAQTAVLVANEHFVNAFLVGDMQGIADHYTAQGRLLLSYTTLITGRLAIQAFWQGVLDMGLCCTERATSEFKSAALLGNEIGIYQLSHRNGMLADRGTYIALWQCLDGLWQVRYEVWRSSLLGEGNRWNSKSVGW